MLYDANNARPSVCYRTNSHQYGVIKSVLDNYKKKRRMYWFKSVPYTYKKVETLDDWARCTVFELGPIKFEFMHCKIRFQLQHFQQDLFNSQRLESN